ncbi:MAG TPA: ATP-binding protein [Solirubrobacterales bacterium]|nr:ATP-binding protein [Solirubrobacterales bacterium]
MYLPRALHPSLSRALGQFPSVLVTGPRQSGKTTFLLEEFGRDAHYLSLDDPLERGFAQADPNGFLDRFPAGRIVLDEIQYAPELLSYLKIRIDRDRHAYGRWLLTGSQQFQVMAHVSESLAGRIALLELLPFSLLELGPERLPDLGSAVWNGGYPEPALQPEKRDLWVASYIQTYVERDIRQILNVQDLRAFETVLGLCAARHGRELNAADLARSAGISQPTVRTWVSLLEAAYIVRLLPPYFENFGKRIIKSPKLYFLDSALICALTRQPGAAAALAGAMGGVLFEGLVVSEAYKVFALLGLRPDLYFWRSHDGLEVDLILRLAGGLTPIEIKLSATPTLRHAEALQRFRSLAGAAAGPEALVVCNVAERKTLPGGVVALPWREFPAWLQERLG